MKRYQTEKIDDPRQIDVEEYIRQAGGYVPGPRQAVAFRPDGTEIKKMTDEDYMTIAKMYAPLRRVLDEAYNQASLGKGRERHANDRPFTHQPIMEITRMHGIGFVTGQASKKAQEAVGMMSRGEYEAAHRELLGAIVYLAAACMRVNEVADESGVDNKSSAG